MFTDHSALEADIDDEEEEEDEVIDSTPAVAGKRKRARKGTVAADATNDNSSTSAVRASGSSRRTTRGRRNNRTALQDSSAQASFEDSNAENDDIAALNDDDDSPVKKSGSKGKRSTRVTRSRPVRKVRVSSSSSNASGSVVAHAGDGTSQQQPLRETSNNVLNLDAIAETEDEDRLRSPAIAAAGKSAAKTPGGTARKRQLYNASAAAEVFTPPAHDMAQEEMTPRTVIKRQLRSRKHK